MYNPHLHFHLVGIGGSGMSGIAEILLSLGFQVSGSDLNLSPLCRRLVNRGATVSQGHAAEHLPEKASLLVYSSAVGMENPEIVEAHRRGIPVIRRAEVLAELMRLKFGVAVAGSHGKTSTTNMVGHLLECGGLDPTVILGGQLHNHEGGGKLGGGEYLVAESDESDRSFLLLKPTIAIVTNIDREHMNAYESFEDLLTSFQKFLGAVPFYGLSVLCVDDPYVCELLPEVRGRKLTYGFSPNADLRATNVTHSLDGSSFSVSYHGKSLGELRLPMFGDHVVLNALAALGVALEFGIDSDVLRKAFATLTGVKRRLEVVGQACGCTVMSDYGHHPTEVRATLSALRSGWGSELKDFRVIFQPHRFSRLKEHYSDFCDAFQDCDRVFITDVYAAGEEPIVGFSGEQLASDLQCSQATYAGTLEQACEQACMDIQDGGLILCLGAGSVGGLPPKVLEQLSSYETLERKALP